MALLRPNESPSVYIETYGCQMNKNDSELIRGILAGSGFGLVENLDDADIVLINTCSVRNHAETRVLGRIGVLAGWKRSSPHRRIGVMGCMAQRLGHELLEIKPAVDFVVGPDGYRDLPSILGTPSPGDAVHTAPDESELYSGIRPVRFGGVCGWVTVSRGCGNFCAYCIVPTVRGPERSRPAAEIEDEARAMAAEGFREITLLGQNVNSYRDGDVDFPDLLRRIGRVVGILRVRFMTSHPKDLSDRLLDAMAESPTVCPHLHLPAQSGSTRILERMNRRYSREQYLERVEAARRRIDGLGLSTDLLVGFPSETEADFEDTLRLVMEVRFDEAFTYYFSPRAGTAAAGMEHQVPEAEKFRRLARLIEAQRAVTLERKVSMVGRIVEVLPERPSRKAAGEWMGRTPDNHVVVFGRRGVTAGRPVQVRIEGCRGTTLRGTPVSESAAGIAAPQKIRMLGAEHPGG